MIRNDSPGALDLLCDLVSASPDKIPDTPDTPDPPDDGDSNDPARATPDIAEIALQAFESLCRRFQKEGRTEAFETAWHRRMVPILGEDISRQAYDRLAALASNEDLEKAPARLMTEFAT